MRMLPIAILVVLLFPGSIAAQSPFAGEWAMTVDDPFNPGTMRLRLEVKGDTVTGSAGGRRFEAKIVDGRFTVPIANTTLTGMADGDGLKGEIAHPEGKATWTAVRVPPRPDKPTTHDFEPSEFHRYFWSKVEPVLRIHPGDTVRTWGVDAGGRDRAGTRRSAGGNPQTGPFYVEGALPGDTLVVKLNRVRLNRDWAQSGRTVMSNALEPSTIAQTKWDQQFESRWRLDTARNVAVLESPTAALKNLTIPLAPMLGCVGVAPPGETAVRTTDSGSFGGNMDYNQLREGTTIYLPVYHPGALLFLGDGHAAQGDGELTGDALETSIDFEFTVDLIKDQSFGHPLAENDEFLMSIGIGGSLDQALRQATSGMMRWLERDYKLAPSEAAMILGFALKYDVVDLVGTQVSVAAKVPKATPKALR